MAYVWCLLVCLNEIVLTIIIFLYILIQISASKFYFSQQTIQAACTFVLVDVDPSLLPTVFTEERGFVAMENVSLINNWRGSVVFDSVSGVPGRPVPV